MKGKHKNSRIITLKKKKKKNNHKWIFLLQHIGINIHVANYFFF